ncbi:MAG: hypothetical protein BMS9Abin04_361 [Planctomycetia bacterium]|nr:MAG: hypothetical protein BMS9Abin04_361 [Planctomycetia bacterium]
MPGARIVSRADTTVLDAYLNPVLRTYLGGLKETLAGGRAGGARAPAAARPAGPGRLRILTSAGGLVPDDRFTGKDSILSGPAGGVVGFARVAEAAGFDRAIGFDMGGTSTDVSRYDGRFEFEYETEKAGVRVVAPMMAIETVAAGGGSLCHFDGVELAVGPASAGADPGPACYGRGGPLAVTDLNFLLGRVSADHFPFPLDRRAVDRRIGSLVEGLERATGRRYAPAELAQGLLDIANANMVKAIRSISVGKGIDPRQYVLVAFGGAAPQHACAVARQLGMTTVLNHPDGGVLSALGIGLADVTRHRAQGVYQPYGRAAVGRLEGLFERLAGAARGELLAEGVAGERIEVRRCLDLRYRGMDACLTIATPGDGDYAAAGQSRESVLRELLLSAEYPTRSVADNLADVRAQVAANRWGVERLREMVDQVGLEVVEAYMEHIQAAAATARIRVKRCKERTKNNFHISGGRVRAQRWPGGRRSGPSLRSDPATHLETGKLFTG